MRNLPRMKQGDDLIIAGEAINQEQQGPTLREEVFRQIGRHDALGIVNGLVSSAWAAILKQLRDSKAHQAFGIDRDRFCTTYLNMSRMQVDKTIATYEEFGPVYFNLNRVVKISREKFRMIAGHVTDEGEIDLGDEKVSITKQNADRIRDFIREMVAAHASTQDKLTHTQGALTKTREERDNARKAAEAAREEIQAKKRKEQELFADATENQRRLLKAQSKIWDAVLLIMPVTQKELDDADQGMVDGLVEWSFKTLAAVSGRDWSAFPMSLAEGRDLMAEYEAERLAKKRPQ